MKEQKEKELDWLDRIKISNRDIISALVIFFIFGIICGWIIWG